MVSVEAVIQICGRTDSATLSHVFQFHIRVSKKVFRHTHLPSQAKVDSIHTRKDISQRVDIYAYQSILFVKRDGRCVSSVEILQILVEDFDTGGGDVTINRFIVHAAILFKHALVREGHEVNLIKRELGKSPEMSFSLFLF